MHTKVAIIGAGPAGLLLSQLLHVAGIESVVVERKSRSYVESRIRAGILEQTTVDLLARAGVDARMRAEGLPHDGFHLGVDGDLIHINLQQLTGKQVMVYGQTELTKDLIAAAIARGTKILFNAENVQLHDVTSDHPAITFDSEGRAKRVDCTFIAGCDGFHGVSRAAIPQDVLKSIERVYPFGWLGILSDVPPCNEELIYSNHERGFALASMRSSTRSRYYIQCALEERVEDWSDERLWDELALRLGPEAGRRMTRGASIEKSIAPLRSFVCEPMSYGRLFLAGDAAHIVPPTGAKGLNLAASDVAILADAFIAHRVGDGGASLQTYSSRTLSRVWKAERFSWWFTGLTHRFPTTSPFDRRMQLAELDYIRTSESAKRCLAENYVGLPLTTGT